jgi:hypothetical protein
MSFAKRYRLPDPFEALRNLPAGTFTRGETGLYGTHSAAYIHTHCIGNNGIPAGRNPPDRHAVTYMAVRHQRYMAEDFRVVGDIGRLLQGAFFHPFAP